MSQFKYQTETDAYRALVNVVPFCVRDAIGAEIARAAEGGKPCLIEAHTLARKYCSSKATRDHAIEVMNDIDFDAIRAEGDAA